MNCTTIYQAALLKILALQILELPGVLARWTRIAIPRNAGEEVAREGGGVCVCKFTVSMLMHALPSSRKS